MTPLNSHQQESGLPVTIDVSIHCGQYLHITYPLTSRNENPRGRSKGRTEFDNSYAPITSTSTTAHHWQRHSRRHLANYRRIPRRLALSIFPSLPHPHLGESLLLSLHPRCEVPRSAMGQIRSAVRAFAETVAVSFIPPLRTLKTSYQRPSKEPHYCKTCPKALHSRLVHRLPLEA
jgi:hypothetical protein